MLNVQGWVVNYQGICAMQAGKLEVARVDAEVSAYAK